jgi:hypothetical protein
VAKPPFRLTPPVVREHPLQEALTKVLRLEIAPPGKLSLPGVCWYSIDHANYHGEVPGTRTARGVVAGLPDVWFHWGGRTGAVELKAADGSLSEAQIERLPILAQSGVMVAVANDAWQVLQILDAWGVPRARRTRVA